MKHFSGLSIKSRRLLIILLSLIGYLFLLLSVILQIVNCSRYNMSTLASFPWLSFGFSSLTAFLFLAVGSLIWLYARQRPLALMFFCFSLMMMITFSVETGADIVPLLGLMGSVAGVIALPLLSAILLIFPKNYFLVTKSSHRYRHAHVGLQSYLFLLVFMSVFIAVALIVQKLFLKNELPWINELLLVEYTIGLIGILITMIITYCSSSSTREHQQIRLFVFGVVVSFAPLLLFTVIPGILQIASIDVRVVVLTISAFPLALGYSVLRYQILVLDRYVRKVVSWVVGILFLAILVYLVVSFCDLFLAKLLQRHIVSYTIGIATVLVLFAPFAWWLARVLTDRLFFSETAYYRRLMEEPAALSEKELSLDEVASLITSAAIQAFEIPRVCVFVLDESAGYYRLAPACSEQPEDVARHELWLSLCRILSLSPGTVSETDCYLDPGLPAIKSLLSARRPLLLSEALRSAGEQSTGLDRYVLSSFPLGEENYLLAPIRSQGEMIGVLILGQRSDGQSYAGPDFEVAQMLLARFSSSLDAACLYARALQHAVLLNSLYAVSTMPGYTFNTLEDMEQTYVEAAAKAASARAELWVYHQQDRSLHLVVAAGTGPGLTTMDVLYIQQERDWSSYFFEGNATKQQYDVQTLTRSCFLENPTHPYAWLPLQIGDRRLGVFVLSYPRAHFFVHEEMRALEMFANQCVVAFENLRMTLELREAYERQKELDQLKDQFIMTASHELRTPLTAVLGYVELLSQYHQQLPVEMVSDFIEKARRGCDELSLLVSNIMDASRVAIDAEMVHLQSLPLQASVDHVVEIFDSVIQREGREVRVDVSADINVLADDVRLCQVLLNLLSNAIKYSPEKTPIEITSMLKNQQVIISIRDYGLGVPPGEQQRLFERFVRLNRDINSPVRGAGLGLFVCKQLLGAMGGSIWVESSGRSGEGSIFSFALPLTSRGQKNAIIVLELPA